ncbi:hypothetical protein [Paraburkholderia sp. SIMBA_030]|uniref:hypothetical protein n=1 Tax=Paraburkholderia sp. SIMBA_030 TaxID=3085773 RepID=UPI00397D9E32
MYKRNSIAALAALFAATLVIGILVLFGIGGMHGTAPKPLIGASGWLRSGDFPEFRDPIDNQQVPSAITSNPKTKVFRTWTPTGAAVGTLTTVPFDLPRYIAVPYAHGGLVTAEPQDKILLQCDATKKELIVSNAQTFDQWVTAYIEVPDDFCPSSKGRLVAQSFGVGLGAYLGIATPFAVSRAMFWTQSRFGSRGLVVLLTWLSLSIVFATCSVLAKQRLNSLDTDAVGFLGLGGVGMGALAAHMISPFVGSVFVITIGIISIALLSTFALTRSAAVRQVLGEITPTLLCWLALSLACVAFLAAADNGAGPWAANTVFSPLSWSVDNQSPLLFLEQFVGGVGSKNIEQGPWLFSDRTPLLTAFLFLPRILVIGPLSHALGAQFVLVADNAAAVTVTAIWIAMLISIVKKVFPQHGIFIVAIVLLTPFTLFNTVYTWGKLLGGAYAVLAFGICAYTRDNPAFRANFVLLPALSMLAILAHASNAFAILPIFLVFAPVLYKVTGKRLGIAAFLAILIASPWGYWTLLVQPHGNALTRFALSNDFGFDHRNRPVVSSVIDAYRRIGLVDWLSLKRRSFGLLVGTEGDWKEFGGPIDPFGNSILGNQRVFDFVVVARSIGAASLGLAGIVIVWLAKSRAHLRVATMDAAICGCIGVVLMTLTIFQLGVTHHQAYGAIFLLAMAGAAFLSEHGGRFTHAVLIAWLIYFTTTWVADPILSAERVEPSAITAFALAVLLLASCLCWLRSSDRSSGSKFP